jgi:hypothetical protein
MLAFFLSVFDSDVIEYIIILATFADRSRRQAMHAIHQAVLFRAVNPQDQELALYKSNNSASFASNRGPTQGAD